MSRAMRSGWLAAALAAGWATGAPAREADSAAVARPEGLRPRASASAPT